MAVAGWALVRLPIYFSAVWDMSDPVSDLARPGFDLI
jgi:hypothetical protein